MKIINIGTGLSFHTLHGKIFSFPIISFNLNVLLGIIKISPEQTISVCIISPFEGIYISVSFTFFFSDNTIVSRKCNVPL